MPLPIKKQPEVTGEMAEIVGFKQEIHEIGQEYLARAGR